MGKGDQRSKKGKIVAGSYGVSRPRKKTTKRKEAKKQRQDEGK
jgi:30S ribosomal protein S31